MAGLILGTSLARGPFISDAASRASVGAGPDAEFTQTAWGGDAEYSRDHYLLRLETIGSRWQMPIAAPPPSQIALQSPLAALAISVEGRYKLRPDFYVAARYDHLGFSDITGAAGTLPWDAPVTRMEIGGGFSLQRNLLLKGSFQHDSRDGGVLQRVAPLLAVQMVYWF